MGKTHNNLWTEIMTQAEQARKQWEKKYGIVYCDEPCLCECGKLAFVKSDGKMYCKAHYIQKNTPTQ